MATFSMNDYWENQGQIPTLADVEDGLEAGPGVGLTISGITQSDMGSGASLITISDSAPASPVNGQVWNKTASTAGEPAVRGMVYDNATSQWLGYPIYYSDTAPSTTGLKTGVLWYDKSLKLLRVYREAAYDPHGIADFHPVSEQYQLWINKSGGIVAPNRVVVQETASGAERGFTTSTVAKDSTVVGVTLATVTSNAYGVIATVAGGAVVDVYCNVTDGDVAIGDGICQSATAGEGRTVGSLSANPAATAGVLQSGVPLGCFAVSQQAITTATMTACRLLGMVGAGAIRRFGEDSCADTTAATGNWTSANWDGTWREIDLESMPLGGDAVVDNGDAKHKPIVGVFVTVELQATGTPQTTGTSSLLVEFGPNASAVTTKVREGANIDGAANWGFWAGQGDVFIPTTAGTPYTSLGQKLQWKGSKNAITAFSTGNKMFITGYRY